MRKLKAVAERDSYYQPSFAAALLALALALLLAWHGNAHADGFAVTPPKGAQLPDTVQGPGADRIPPGLACSDEMDLPPEANLPSPFDGAQVALRGAHKRAPSLLTISGNDGCPAAQRQKIDRV